MVTDIYGRIIENEHVDRFVLSDEDKLRSVHTQSDLVNTLNLLDAQFDSDSTSKNFSAKELHESLNSSKDVVTIYDTDRVKGLKRDFDAIDKAKNGD